jgi:hypothetical protein
MWGAMTDLEPASALAVRIAEDCYQPVDNWDSGDSSSFDREKCAELIEQDRAAVREAALRELAEAVLSMRPDLGFARHESSEYKGGFREGHSSALAEVENLLTEKRTP